MTGSPHWSIPRPQLFGEHRLDYLQIHDTYDLATRKCHIFYAHFREETLPMSMVSFRWPHPAIVTISLSYVFVTSFTFDAMHMGRTVLLNAMGWLTSSNAIQWKCKSCIKAVRHERMSDRYLPISLYGRVHEYSGCKTIVLNAISYAPSAFVVSVPFLFTSLYSDMLCRPTVALIRCGCNISPKLLRNWRENPQTNTIIELCIPENRSTPFPSNHLSGKLTCTCNGQLLITIYYLQLLHLESKIGFISICLF